MKIALIRKDYSLAWGGAERYAVNLSECLARMGHEVHVFANTWSRPPDHGISIHKVPILTISSSLKNLSFAYNCRKLLARENFDIVHSLSQTFSQDIYRMGDGIHRHWLTIQTPNFFYRFLKTLTPRQQVILFLEKKTFHPLQYKMIICISQLCKKHAMSYFKVPEEKIRVIYNGVDHAQFNPGLRNRYNKEIRKKLQIPEEAVVILFIANNFKRKGLKHLLQSLPLIQRGKEPLTVLVVGRGNPLPFRRIAEQIELSDQLLFVAQTDNIFQYYGVGDIVAHPALSDPFSNVCLEALACGIPVITTKETGASEIIRPEETGVVISDPHDHAALAAGISRFLPHEVRDLVRKKASQSVQNFTIEENTLKTLKAYKQVLEIKKHKGGFQ
ncbi:MAG: glycosyltransferase family 4 protein [Thermodesulfobacteriota bacterium]|nr:MAG: glycosyltransferase family 4 protein [Thermodesulfobacteriota bacterium]